MIPLCAGDPLEPPQESHFEIHCLRLLRVTKIKDMNMDFIINCYIIHGSSEKAMVV